MTEAQRKVFLVLIGFILLLASVIGVVIFLSRRKPPEGDVAKPTDPEALGAAPAGSVIAAPAGSIIAAPAGSITVAEASLMSGGQAGKLDDEFAASKTLKEALLQTEKTLFGRIKTLFKGGSAHQHFEALEEILYTSDLGPQTVERLMAAVKTKLSKSEAGDISLVKESLAEEFKLIFKSADVSEAAPDQLMSHLQLSAKPAVWMVVGVNGAGKTTSIGKLAAHLARSGKKVLVAAGDTFRAAAGNQLKVWTERAQVEIFSPDGVKDPSAVAYDAIAKAKAQGYDVVIIDTAGRLHTQANLMEELKKMKRVMGKVIAEAPHETLIVLDANSGQNALLQAKEFHQALILSGVILTKMDGTAKGGVAVGIANELKIPIRLIGVGEKIGDLRPFSSKDFADSILY